MSSILYLYSDHHPIFLRSPLHVNSNRVFDRTPLDVRRQGRGCPLGHHVPRCASCLGQGFPGAKLGQGRGGAGSDPADCAIPLVCGLGHSRAGRVASAGGYGGAGHWLPAGHPSPGHARVSSAGHRFAGGRLELPARVGLLAVLLLHWPGYRVEALQMKNCLRDLRAERDWTQADLAERLRVSRQTVNAIETEKYEPSLTLAFKIARLFGKRIEEIFEPPAANGKK